MPQSQGDGSKQKGSGNAAGKRGKHILPVDQRFKEEGGEKSPAEENESTAVTLQCGVAVPLENSDVPQEYEDGNGAQPDQESADHGVNTSQGDGQESAEEEKSSNGQTSDSGSGHARPSNYKTRLCMKWQQQNECSFGARCNFAHGMHELRAQVPDGQQNSSHDSNNLKTLQNQNPNQGGGGYNQKEFGDKENHISHKQEQQHMQQHNCGPHLNQHNNNRPPPSNRKTRLCTKFVQYQSCPYGDRCNFAHGEHELQNVGPTPYGAMAPGMGGGGVMGGAGGGGGSGGGRGGGGNMSGSGGNRNTNFKTRICTNWQQLGQCTYGSRCNFAHGVHELRGNGNGGEWASMEGFVHSGFGMGYGNMQPIGAFPNIIPPDMKFQGQGVPMGAGRMPFVMPPMGMDQFARQFMTQMVFPPGQGGMHDPSQEEAMMHQMAQMQHHQQPMISGWAPQGNMQAMNAHGPRFPIPASGPQALQQVAPPCQ